MNVLVKQNEDWKKIPGTGISNPGTAKKIPALEKKSRVPGFQIPVLKTI